LRMSAMLDVINSYAPALRSALVLAPLTA
jgi:hypothetical protein